MKILSFVFMSCLCASVTSFSNFYHFQTLNGLKNKYVNFFQEKIDSKLYEDEMDFYVSKLKVVDKNKDLYVWGITSVQGLLKFWNENARIEISHVSILPDRCLFQWTYFCDYNIKLYGSSLYKLNQKSGKVMEHTLEISNIGLPNDVYIYTHPRLWKPIKIPTNKK